MQTQLNRERDGCHIEAPGSTGPHEGSNSISMLTYWGEGKMGNGRDSEMELSVSPTGVTEA